MPGKDRSTEEVFEALAVEEHLVMKYLQHLLELNTLA